MTPPCFHLMRAKIPRGGSRNTTGQILKNEILLPKRKLLPSFVVQGDGWFTEDVEHCGGGKLVGEVCCSFSSKLPPLSSRFLLLWLKLPCMTIPDAESLLFSGEGQHRCAVVRVDERWFFWCNIWIVSGEWVVCDESAGAYILLWKTSTK